jgi:hypothetical protein
LRSEWASPVLARTFTTIGLRQAPQRCGPAASVESLGCRLRDELLAVEASSSLLEARVLVEDWRIEDNTVRPTAPRGY